WTTSARSASSSGTRRSSRASARRWRRCRGSAPASPPTSGPGWRPRGARPRWKRPRSRPTSIAATVGYAASTPSPGTGPAAENARLIQVKRGADRRRKQPYAGVWLTSIKGRGGVRHDDIHEPTDVDIEEGPHDTPARQ